MIKRKITDPMMLMIRLLSLSLSLIIGDDDQENYLDQSYETGQTLYSVNNNSHVLCLFMFNDFMGTLLIWFNTQKKG